MVWESIQIIPKQTPKSMIMGNIYEAVMVVDEELGMEEASEKEAIAIASTTTTASSANETGELIRRSLTVIIYTNVNVCMLSIDLSVSQWYVLSWLWFQTDHATHFLTSFLVH